MQRYDHEGEKRITTPEEARAWVDREWKKVSKHDWYRKWYREWITSGCATAGWLIAFIIEIVFRDVLPVWLIQTHGRRRGTLLEVAGVLLGSGAGWLVSRIVIRRMKREEKWREGNEDAADESRSGTV